MYRDECAASALGLKGDREEVVWRCPQEECGRYFHGTVGYLSHVTIANRAIPTPRCGRESWSCSTRLARTFCPVAGCRCPRGGAFLSVHQRRELRNRSVGTDWCSQSVTPPSHLVWPGSCRRRRARSAGRPPGSASAGRRVAGPASHRHRTTELGVSLHLNMCHASSQRRTRPRSRTCRLFLLLSAGDSQ